MTEQGYVAWPVPGVPYASIHIPLRDSYADENGDRFEYTDEQLIEQAHDVASKLYRAFPPEKQGNGAQRAPVASGGQPRGAGQSRTDRFALVQGEVCDSCQGPVGLKPLTGNQSSDSIVCLGRCTDPNNRPGQSDYVHRVRWADSQPQQTSVPLPAGMPDADPIDPDDLPF